MESGQGNERISTGNSMANTDGTMRENGLLNPIKKSGSSLSSSSTSSSASSFDENLFQQEGIEMVEPNNLEKSTISPPKPDGSHLASKDGEKVVPIVIYPKSEGSDIGSPGPKSPLDVSGVNLELLENGPVKQSPPLQVMGRTDEPRPYRIPSSVFARSKSATPQEWSVASNESLFSIHMGNNSFSRDQMILMGRSGELDLGKSGELIFPLNKAGELIIPGRKSEELNNFETTPPLGNTIVGHEKNNSDSGEDLAVTEAAAETMKEVLRVAAEDRDKVIKPASGSHISSSISRHSDGSSTSVRSFAFPILTGDGGKSRSAAKTGPKQQNEQTPQSNSGTITNKGGNKWLFCFSFCPVRS